MSNGSDSDYLSKSRKYGKIILLVDLLLILIGAIARIEYDVEYQFGAVLIAMGVLFLLFPYVRHPNWSERECKARVRASGIICIVFGAVMVAKDAALF